MATLSEAKLRGLRALIADAPEAVIDGIESSLYADGARDATTRAIASMISEERERRRLQSRVFAPVIALFQPRNPVAPKPEFPPETFKLIWRDLTVLDPDLMNKALRDLYDRVDGEVPESFDVICLTAAEALSEGRLEVTLARLRKLGLDPERLAQILRLAPLSRTSIPKLDGWLRNLNPNSISSVRLAFKDAAKLCDDGGVLQMEVFFAQMVEPWQILRLISAVMDKPSDRYLGQSELGLFGERLLDDIDRRIGIIKAFDPGQGEAAAGLVAAEVTVVLSQLDEFDRWITLDPANGWGRRLTQSRRGLAQAIEARLKQVEAAVDAALPSAAKSSGSKAARAPARLDVDPDPQAATRALAMLVFADRVKSSATLGGYGAFRAKVMEAVAVKLHAYVEDLLDHLRSEAARDGPPKARVQAFLNLAARCAGLAIDADAEATFRRRIEA